MALGKRGGKGGSAKLKEKILVKRANALILLRSRGNEKGVEGSGFR